MMRFFSRFSRQTEPAGSSPVSTVPAPTASRDSLEDSPVEVSEPENTHPSSPSSPQFSTKDSEGYPSWLPKRPLHPAPASTFQSSVVAIAEPGPSSDQQQPQYMAGGRRQTPRSVRIVSLQDDYGYVEKDRREPTDQTKVNVTSPRVWSRATGATVSPTVFDSAHRRGPSPKFRSRGLHLELLRNPSIYSRLYFYLYRLFIFFHIPLQTFFDFNAVFVLVQVAKFPNPDAPGVPGSGRNWALGAAAYVACWFIWIVGIFIVYELVYSFARLWRTKRPSISQIYLSTPAFNFVAVSSYTHFCFLQHIRYTAFATSVRDGLAETFWFYSQNLPTVALLLPRAGLSLALLLAFSSAEPGLVALAATGVRERDETFFRGENGTLTNYARGVLIANAVWTAWRFLVLLFSWIGLWVVSGQGCAGLCGPRYRWEEEDGEKTVISDNLSDIDVLPWNWKECTRDRIRDAYEFCLTIRPAKQKDPLSPTADMEQILAAVGLGSTPHPARRGVLTDDLFQGPHGEQVVRRTETPPELSSIIPKVVKQQEGAGPSSGGPLMSLPYPFTAQGAAYSSVDKVPFPPSPNPSDEKTTTGDEEEDDDDAARVGESEEPSSGRASGSMSSLGQPVSSRYPFQFRRPMRGTSSSSGGAPSHQTPTHSNSNSHSHSNSNGRSMYSRVSQATHSTGNRESTDSNSPQSRYTSSSDPASPGSPLSQRSSGGLSIPMPPRHPQGRAGRGRAGTVPIPSSPGSPSPPAVAFPRRTRVESDVTEAFGPPPGRGGIDLDFSDIEMMMEQPEPEGSNEEAEGEDFVGLLSDSNGPSPRPSLIALRRRASTLSHHRSSRSRSGSNSRTNSHSGSSSSRSRAESLTGAGLRERAQSLLQASRSSLELVIQRARATSSIARLEDDSPDDRTMTHSRSGSGSGVSDSAEGHTFGRPIRTALAPNEEPVEEEGSVPPSPLPPRSYEGGREEDNESENVTMTTAPSPSQSAPHPHPGPEPSVFSMDRTASPARSQDTAHRDDRDLEHDHDLGLRVSHPDISTANPSFVTAAPTMEGSTTESSGRTPSSWGGGFSHMVERSDTTWRPA